MTRNELIASVALDFVKSQLDSEPDGTLRFCMIGLEASLVVSIAEAVLNDAAIGTEVSVKIDPLFDPANKLPDSARSEESITHWRHARLLKQRAVLFVASQTELQRNDKSVEKITKLETDTLRVLYDSWITQSGLRKELPGKEKHIRAALEAANETHAARTIESFADFVVSIANSTTTEGLPLQKAVDNALPSLHFPRFAGHFDRIPESKRAKTTEWTKIFRRLLSQVRPLLVKETDRGEPITEKLSKNFEEQKETLSPEQLNVVQNFLNADLALDKWADEQQALVEEDWRSLSGLFEGINKTVKLNLGQRTIKFFDDEFDDQLDDEERSLLESSFPKNPTEELNQFFFGRREQISQDKKLSSDWEKFIYRNPETYDDFLVGLTASIHRLREQNEDEKITERKLEVRIPRADTKSFWRGKNAKVARYFAYRYRGLDTLLGDDIELSFGKLYAFFFPEIDEELKKSTSAAKDARTIKFEVVLDPKGVKAKMMFFWQMPVGAIATALPDDLLNIASVASDKCLLPTAEITRQTVNTKGGIQRIGLDDVNTIRDVSNANDGRLVAPNSSSGDRSDAFLDELAAQESLLTQGPTSTIRTKFADFHSTYSQAIRDWVGEDGLGIAADSLITQSDVYGELLRTLGSNANNDRSREGLWKEILRVGVANVGAGAPAAIVTPWHPMRLAEIATKARQVSSLIRKVLHADKDDVYRADLLFGQMRLDLEANYYPEVAIGFHNEGAELLSAADTLYDYTLCELPKKPERTEIESTVDVDPAVAAKAFSAVGEHYLKLLPHERSNFALVLYNSESKALPNALAAELSSKVEKESELQCDLLLTHSDPKQMRRIYEQQNAAVSEAASSAMASESARNFLSRLRVGFLDATDLSDDANSRAADIVALQDVIARNANLVWKRAPSERHPELLENFPARWSRRRPVGPGDAATAVYLAAPTQPLAGQRYLNAVHAFLKGDNALDGDVIPAREVSFQESDIDDVFTQTHRIGEWVVNFDEIVDRRLLANNDIKVIRHIHDRSINRNVIVSTTSRPRLLNVLLEQRLNNIDPAIIQSHGAGVVDRLIDQANTLSGQVVMRAARYGHYSNELLGVVLSMEKIKASLGGGDLPVGWFFLDDYASWFGQKEEQIADIMAIAPRTENGEPVLMVALGEAKFVASHGYKSHAKKSAKQLEETAIRISRALEPSANRIDREIWLHRLGDFMIEGMEPFEAKDLNNWDLHRWSDEVRQNNVTIKLIGYSHVFVHDDENYVDATGELPLKNMEHCFQETSTKSQVADALKAFASETGTPGSIPSTRWDDALNTASKREEDAESSTSVEQPLNPQEFTGESGDATTQGLADETKPNDHPVLEPEKPQLDEKATDELSESEDLPQELLRAWPSRALAEWVSQGKASDDEDEDARQWLNETVSALRRALRGYDMTAELVGSRLTPNAALVRFRGSDDLTVPMVEKKSQQLLTTHAIRVINVLAAPMEVVVMVARPTRAILKLQDLWSRRKAPESTPESNTSLLLGAKESDGELLYLNVGEGFAGLQPHGPHTLIAGETGSGKGVLVQCLLLDICATNSPANARIRMIDPKAGIDFPWLRKMPHLDGDLITDQAEAVYALEELVGEMERRNKLLAEAGVTKLANYNKKVEPAERLPRIWLFHDELADWMLIKEYREAVELNASRLGVKARAAGINLVLVTQRPDKDALPMQLRANLNNRLVLKVADKRNSELVLDQAGAERLLGRGHLAAKLSGEPDIELCQVPFANEDGINSLATIICNSWLSQAIRATNN